MVRRSITLFVVCTIASLAGCGGNPAPSQPKESAAPLATQTAEPSEQEMAADTAEEFMLALQDEGYSEACTLAEEGFRMSMQLLGNTLLVADQLESGQPAKVLSDKQQCAAGMQQLAGDWGVQFAEAGRTRQKDEFTVQVEIKSAGEPMTVELTSYDNASTSADEWKVSDLVAADGQRYLAQG
jgi:hypothetical protein